MSRVFRDFNSMKVKICIEAVTVCIFKVTKHDCIDLLLKVVMYFLSSLG